MSDSEKKLPPSWKRLHDARRDGKVIVSRDLSQAVGSLAATATLAATGAIVVAQLSRLIANDLVELSAVAHRDITGQELLKIVLESGAMLATTAGPIAAAGALAALFTGLVQTRFNFATRALRLSFDGLNPKNGFARFKFSRAGIDTLKATVVATAIGFVAWKLCRGLIEETPRMAWEHPLRSFSYGWDTIVRLLWQVGFALLAFGGVDYAIQRWRIRDSLKMSVQDYKDEAKEESNPEVKSRIRRIMREQHRKRMMSAVKTATVVITNPTHFAVALEYNRAKNPAPVVVAKGADAVAARIRQLAREHSVPIIENPPLARALFKECELGDTIPGPLFGAVAEILAYLIRIKQLVI